MRLSGTQQFPRLVGVCLRLSHLEKQTLCLNPSSFGWGGKRLGIERGSGAPFHPTALTDSQPQIYGSWRAHGNSARWPATFCHILGRCSECRDKCEPSHSRGSRFYKRHKIQQAGCALSSGQHWAQWIYFRFWELPSQTCTHFLDLKYYSSATWEAQKALFLNWKAQDGCTSS